MSPSARKADSYEFDAERVAHLLGQLDGKLRGKGVGAAVFVVGGAAIAATGIRAGRLASGVDALTRDQVVIDEARALAVEEGLSPAWLNANAAMWMPPLPAGVLDPPDHPGLRVTYAEDGFLLATKLVAQRAKDADDIVALAAKLDLTHASPTQLEEHIRRYYTDPGSLEFILDGNDVDQEIALLAQDASRMLSRTNYDQGNTTETKAPEPRATTAPGSTRRRTRPASEPHQPAPPATSHREPPGPGRGL